MSRGEQEEERQASWAGSLLRGFDAAVSNNAQAFGFSITVTVTFGVVSAQDPNAPTRLELLGFAMAAVAAFAMLNVVGVLLLEKRAERQSERMLLVATATDFLAVGAAVGAAIGLAALIGGWAAWVAAPFAAGIVYVLVQSLELAVGDRREDG